MTDLQFNFTTDPVNDMEIELRKLQDRQNELLAEQRQIIKEIQNKRNEIAKLRIEQTRQRELQKVEEAKRKLELQEQELKKELEETYRKIEELNPPSWDKARSYQIEDIVTAYHAYLKGESGFLNANYMGLGKTYETIMLLLLLFKEFPQTNCLWLTKSNILETGGTAREIKRWSKDQIPVIELKGSMPKVQRETSFEMIKHLNGVVVLTNYESLRTTKSLANTHYEWLVMDEVHKLKGGANISGPTALWKAVKEFTPRTKFVQMLTGTPMVNRVAEIWAYLHIFDPEKFHSLREFENAFNTYVDMGGKIEVDKILDMCLKGRMVRRTRKDIGKEEIPFQDIDIEVVYNPQQQKVYNEMRDQFYIWLDERREEVLTATAVIAQLIRLRQISVWPVFSQKLKDENNKVISERKIEVHDSAKIDELMDKIEELDESCLVFCNFNEPFEEVARRCRNIGKSVAILNGTPESKKRMGEFEVNFQQGKLDVLCINSAMGEGMNLQKDPEQWPGGTTTGFMLDEWWNASRDEQCWNRYAGARAVFPCVLYRFFAPNTVDGFVRAISQEKSATFEGILTDDRVKPAFKWKEELRKVLG